MIFHQSIARKLLNPKTRGVTRWQEGALQQQIFLLFSALQPPGLQNLIIEAFCYVCGTADTCFKLCFCFCPDGLDVCE